MLAMAVMRPPPAAGPMLRNRNPRGCPGPGSSSRDAGLSIPARGSSGRRPAWGVRVGEGVWGRETAAARIDAAEASRTRRNVMALLYGNEPRLFRAEPAATRKPFLDDSPLPRVRGRGQ